MASTVIGNRIVNPSAGNVYYSNAGSAISAQPTVDVGRALGLGTTASAGMSQLALGDDTDRTFVGSKARGGRFAGAADYGNAVGSVTIAASGGFARYSKTSHGRSVGDIIQVSDTNSVVDGPQRVTSIVSSSQFKTDKPYTSGAGTVDYKVASGNFNTMTKGYYVMRRVSTVLGGMSNSVLLSGASDLGDRRSIHKLTTVRTVRTATAIRAGYWKPTTGTWSTAPTENNDGLYSISANAQKTDGSADDEANASLTNRGELVYKESKPLPTRDDYPARTG